VSDTWPDARLPARFDDGLETLKVPDCVLDARCDNRIVAAMRDNDAEHEAVTAELQNVRGLVYGTGGKLTPRHHRGRLARVRAARLEAMAAPGEINREFAIVRRAFRLAAEADKYHGRIRRFGCSMSTMSAAPFVTTT
jgi:hypothetical protein